LFHLDLYRLETKEQILSAGLEEYLRPDGVAVIEWAERWFGEVQNPTGRAEAGPRRESQIQIFPSNFRWVKIETLTENERRISYEDFGA
jgi:tRNA A37 threonylcarbamoyladenosine biosynthesis protein TsaE